MDSQLLSALLGAGATIIGGSLFLRWRQRVAWEEASQGELAKLRYDALVELIRATNAVYVAKVYRLSGRRPGGAPEGCDQERIEHEEEDAITRLQLVSLEKMYLVPREFRREIRDPLAALMAASTDRELERSSDAIGDVLEAFLPALPRRQLRRRDY